MKQNSLKTIRAALDLAPVCGISIAAEPARKKYLKITWVALSFVLAGGIVAAAEPVVQDKADQAIQQELAEPFCYFMVPTDQIGFKNCPKATIVTSAGAFVSAYGQLSFCIGAPESPQSVNKRVKTLLEDYLPVIRFGFDRDGLRYEFEAFATPINLDPRSNLITFVECTVRNPAQQARSGVLQARFGDIAPEIVVDSAYGRAREYHKRLKEVLRAQRASEWHSKLFMDELVFQAGRERIVFENGLVIQGSHLVFTGPAAGAESLGREAALTYRFTLQPAEQRVFRFKMPAVPVALAKPDAVRQVVSADHDDYRTKTIAYWKAEVARADRFLVADPKVMNTFRTSLVNDLIAREMGEEGRIYQRVNRIHYNYFWVRDGSYFVRTYDMLGLHQEAREMLDAFLVWQEGKPVRFFSPGAPQPKGARLSVQDDYWGQVLWAFGAHIRTTGDHTLLELVYPLLSAHIAEFTAKCAKDPRGLWPVAGPYDNEAINGHYTGHSFWALLGLKYAVFMAKAIGRAADAQEWQKAHDDYQANCLKQLRELAAKSEGYIPPGMDSVTDGNDWDNASGGLYPFEVLAADDPLARKTLEMVRNYNYREGIITYGGNAWVARQLKREGKRLPEGTLHHYEIFYVTEGNTILGEQRRVIEDLYSILAHTGSTNSGFEFGIPAWTSRDPGDNFTPHGWFAARYMSQVRNMLVREEGEQVHIASVLAPAWVKPGRQVKVTMAPTFFGSVTYTLECRQDGATLTFDNRWNDRERPTAVVFHIPWFLEIGTAKVDGKSIPVVKGALMLPPDARRVELGWSWTEEPHLSYEEAVRLYLEKYYRLPAGANYDYLFPMSPTK